MRTVFQLNAGRFSHGTRGVEARLGVGVSLELFAFSVSLFQRQKEGSDLSHMRRRYMEGQMSRVGVSTTSHFLDLEFLALLDVRDTRCRQRRGALLVNTGVLIRGKTKGSGKSA